MKKIIDGKEVYEVPLLGDKDSCGFEGHRCVFDNNPVSDCRQRRWALCSKVAGTPADIIFISPESYPTYLAARMTS